MPQGAWSQPRLVPNKVIEMKLLHCVACGDVFALRREDRTCECGQSVGRYTDNVHAEYRGPARVLGMRNQEIHRSLRDVHVPFVGPHYRWWVITEGEHIHRADGDAGVMHFEQVVTGRESRDGTGGWVEEIRPRGESGTNIEAMYAAQEDAAADSREYTARRRQR